jgi:hypothetical protein
LGSGFPAFPAGIVRDCQRAGFDAADSTGCASGWLCAIPKNEGRGYWRDLLKERDAHPSFANFGGFGVPKNTATSLCVGQPLPNGNRRD